MFYQDTENFGTSLTGFNSTLAEVEDDEKPVMHIHSGGRAFLFDFAVGDDFMCTSS
jgi:hypothetical protein